MPQTGDAWNRFGRAALFVGAMALFAAGGATFSSPDAAEAAEPPPKRAVPDLDGREDPPMSAGEALLWVPRVLFFPVHVVTEYVVRRPLGFVVTTAEQNHWPRLIVDFFTFTDEGNVGLIPTAFWEFNFQPSAGLYFFFDDLVVDDNDFRLHFAAGGADLLLFRVRDRYRFGPRHSVSARFEATTRPDYSFSGIGSAPALSDSIRYSSTVYSASLTSSRNLWRSSKLVIELGYRAQSFGSGQCCGDLSIGEALQRGLITELPPGFERGLRALESRAYLVVDSRQTVPKVGTGVRLELEGRHGFDRVDPTEVQWVNWRAAMGGFVDVGYDRVVGLSGHVLFADPLGDAPVPFTELVELGGDNPMRNVRSGRLLGRSAAVASVEYAWPVWIWLDGRFEASVGNVFGPGLGDFELDLLRYGFNLGFETSGSPDHSFGLLVGLGSETFREGGGIDDVRFFLGARSGL